MADAKSPKGKSSLRDGGPPPPTPNSFNAVGIVTREEPDGPASPSKHNHGTVSIAFARSGPNFKLLPRHRERVVDMSLLAHPHVVEDYHGYFKSVKLRSHHGNVQGHLHLCSCAYPDSNTRGANILCVPLPLASRADRAGPARRAVDLACSHRCSLCVRR